MLNKITHTYNRFLFLPFATRDCLSRKKIKKITKKWKGEREGARVLQEGCGTLDFPPTVQFEVRPI